jgi:DNA-binding transcriptional MerR regulator
MYTVKNIADYLGLSVSGVHRWVDKYESILSPAASDSSDEGRKFDEGDVKILWTVKVLRDQNMSHKDISEQLKGGYRLTPDLMPDEVVQTPAVPRSEVATLRHQIGLLNAEIDRLRDLVGQKDTEIERLKGQVEALERALKTLFESK